MAKKSRRRWTGLQCAREDNADRFYQKCRASLTPRSAARVFCASVLIAIMHSTCIVVQWKTIGDDGALTIVVCFFQILNTLVIYFEEIIPKPLINE